MHSTHSLWIIAILPIVMSTSHRPRFPLQPAPTMDPSFMATSSSLVSDTVKVKEKKFVRFTPSTKVSRQDGERQSPPLHAVVVGNTDPLQHPFGFGPARVHAPVPVVSPLALPSGVSSSSSSSPAHSVPTSDSYRKQGKKETPHRARRSIYASGKVDTTWTPITALREAERAPTGFLDISYDDADHVIDVENEVGSGDIVEELAEASDDDDDHGVPITLPKGHAPKHTAPLPVGKPRQEQPLSTSSRRYDHVKRYTLLSQGQHSLVFRGKMDGRIAVTKGETVQRTWFGKPKPKPVVLKMAPRKTHAGEQLQREELILNMLSHPNVIRAIDDIPNEEYVILVLPYYSQGTLAQYVQTWRESKLVLVGEHVRRLLAPIAQAVGHCHDHGVAHMNIRLDNVVMGGTLRQPHPILIDFGHAYHYQIHRRLPSHRNAFSAPELFQSNPPQPLDPFALDVWALGVTLLATLIGYEPSGHESVTKFVQNGMYLWWCPGLKALLEGMLETDPRKRMTMNAVRVDTWWHTGC